MTTPRQNRGSLVPLAALAMVLALTAYPIKVAAAPSNAYLGQPYAFTLTSTFGTAPYTYQLESGDLPPGIAMDQSGDIRGTPATPGQFPFGVLVTDSSQPPQHKIRYFTLNVLIAVTTYHNDNYRSGTNTNETVLTPSNVNVQAFGKRFVFPVQGWVLAQPLYVPGVNIKGAFHNLVFIATEHDQVYAFDVDSGKQIWQRSFLYSSGGIIVSTVTGDEVHCVIGPPGKRGFPEIGVMGTPVINTSTGTMYLVAKTKRYNPQTQQTTYHMTLHALDITTGLDKVAPQPITATVPGTGTGSVNGMLVFGPLVEAQRPGLTMYQSGVFVAFGSYCDYGNFHGWIMAFDSTTLLPSGVMVDTPNGYEGAFWAGGSGLNVDSAGNIYGGTGNGHFDADQGGIDYGDTILKLNWSPESKSFAVEDYFTPWDQLTLDETDFDLGGGGILLLPDQPGTKYPHLLVQAGKEGTIDLVNRDNMGHFHSGDDSQIVQTIPHALHQIWGSPAFWNNNIYWGGWNDYLKAFSFDPDAQRVSTTYTSKTPEVFGPRPPSTPSVSANGNTNGIVWATENVNYPDGPAILRAYDATNLANELYNSSQNPARDQAGLAVQLTIPTVVDGHVFVGAENEVDMYGLLH